LTLNKLSSVGVCLGLDETFGSPFAVSLAWPLHKFCSIAKPKESDVLYVSHVYQLVDGSNVFDKNFQIEVKLDSSHRQGPALLCWNSKFVPGDVRPYLFDCKPRLTKLFSSFYAAYEHGRLTIKDGLHFFISLLIERYRWRSVFPRLHFVDQTLFAFCYLQHRAHIRHRKDYYEHIAVVVMKASLPESPVERETFQYAKVSQRFRHPMFKCGLDLFFNTISCGLHSRAANRVNTVIHQSITVTRNFSAKCIAALVSACPNECEMIVKQFMMDIGNQKSTDSIRTFVLLALGEIGQNTDLSGFDRLDEVCAFLYQSWICIFSFSLACRVSSSNSGSVNRYAAQRVLSVDSCFKLLHQVVMGAFSASNEEVKYAASFSLGRICIGNLQHYLPGMLTQIQMQVRLFNGVKWEKLFYGLPG